ncbi:helix-hairpin-helix domain-containing protein [Fibrella sp. HMF5036]|uniref:Helix-hairpin-helix domain-containing protein n=1 Tax=Fibrella aquatilis TaxID=2817059 RepID=A0A939G7B9_9BACT|nr:helix-hairpin-helix domain-containing protein [Fibrella aquatilis]
MFPVLPVQTPGSVRPDEALTRLFQVLFPVQTDGIDYAAVFDNLAQFYTNPLDLNRATHDELAATYLLTERQINSLISYRTAYGDLLAVAELQAVPEFDVGTIQRLRPFATIRTGTLTADLPAPTDNYLMLRYERVLEEQKGFSPATPDSKGKLPLRYLGSPGQWYGRFRQSRPGVYSVGVTMEQDPGEAFRWNPDGRQYGIDYVSFHAQIQNRGRWRNVIVGDFQQQVGQGLVFSAGFSLGKNAETILTVRRPTLGARPYTSLTEYGYLRGLSATYALLPNLDITLLAARNRRDGNVITGATTADEDVVSSFGTSGLHQTPTDLLDLRSVLETNLGGHLHFHRNGLQIGLSVLQTAFDKTLKKRDQTYNQYEFMGKQNLVAGLHGSHAWRSMNLFGEVAYSSGSVVNSGGIGAVGGVLASLGRRVDVALLARHYDRNFHSFYANAFGEASKTSNETGVYGGVKYSIYRRLTLSGFVDWFRFPWWKYLIDAPSDGFDYLLSAQYSPDRQTHFALIFHDEHKEKNRPGGLPSGSKLTPKEVVNTVRRSLTLTAEWTPAPGLTLRSRLQAGLYGYTSSSTSSQGFAVVQDATYERGRLSLSGRLAYFNTDDYDSRQYVYERDVLYAFSFPAYADQGFRHYLLARYQVNQHLDVWFRYARTDLLNQPDIGSGLDLISAPHKTDLTVQGRWRF